uniref:1-phosphatidylinositol 4-kinase n=1 Tax=Rhabditophanes sp. KR3021 TaxID=114890 RepID=A0AC35TLJ8_9BILA
MTILGAKPNDSEFAFNNRHCIALCCAKIYSLKLEDVQDKLGISDLIEGIQNSCLNCKTRDSLVVTAVYLVNCDGQHAEVLTHFLLNTLTKLWELKWADDDVSSSAERMTIYERFTFCLTIALNDIGVRFPFLLKDILDSQSQLMLKLIEMITQNCEEEKTNELVGKAHLMRLVCIFLGLTRAFGRFGSEKAVPLISELYPEPIKNKHPLKRLKIGLNTDSSNWFSEKCVPEEATKEAFNVRKIFLRPGSSFVIVDDNIDTIVPIEYIESLLNSFESLLNETTFDRLDMIADQVYRCAEFRRFYYKSVSELITLSSVTMIRDCIKPFCITNLEDCPVSKDFAKYLINFILNLFRKGESDLTKLKVDYEGPQWNSKIKQVIIANSVCLQIIVWTAIEENDGDSICNTISDQMLRPHQHVTAYIPVVVVALDCLGVMSNKFPTLASIYITSLLQNFLLEPCSLLRHLISEVYGSMKTNAESKETDSVHLRKRQGLACLRNAAIDALCTAVKAAREVEENSENSCMASLSAKLYLSTNSTKNTVGYFVAETAILILGKLGVLLNEVPNVPESILQIFLQRFANPSNKLDTLIINCLADIWLSGANSIFEQMMKLFTTVIVGSSNHVYSSSLGGENKYSHVSLEVDKVLARIADTVTNEKMKEMLLTRYLELFVQLAVEGRKSGQKVSKGTMKITTSAGNLGVLIPKIAALLKKFPSHIDKPNQKLKNLFREFWCYCTVLGFDVKTAKLWPEEWFEAVCEISKKSPIFIANENLKTELIDNVGISALPISAAELEELKQTICCELKQETEIITIVKNMDFTHLIYLLSVIRMEKMRVMHSEDVNAVHLFFQYIQNPAVKNDKSGMWLCLRVAAQVIFEEYLVLAVALQASECDSEELERNLVYHTRFFLLQFNHHMKEVRMVGDWCFTKLVNAFPKLLWNGDILYTELKLIQSLSTNLENDPDCKVIFLEVETLPWKIQLQSTIEGKRKIAEDFINRCEGILNQAMVWSPGTTHSYLLDYICKTNSMNDNSLRLTIETVLKNCSKQNSEGTTGSSHTPDISEFFLSLNMRSLYLGQIGGMLDMLQHSSGEINEESLAKTMVSKLEKDFDLACIASNKDLIKNSIMLMTALFISLKDTNIALLQTLVRVPLKNFTEDTMKMCIHSWNWILVAKKEIEIKFLQEMSSCWQIMMHKKVGLFQREVDYKDPLTVQYAKKKISPNVKPHAIWITFISERVSLAKYSSHTQLDLFKMMFMQTFSLVIGDKMTKNSPIGIGSEAGSYLANHIPLMARSIETVGVRFNILTAVLTMVQEDTSPSRISKNVLRQRIYACAFDYFSIAPQVPTQTIAQLKNDLKQLITFYKAIHSEVKHVKEEFAGFTDADISSELGSFKGSSAINTLIASSNTMSSMSNIGNAHTWHHPPTNNPSWANTITIVAAHNKTAARSATLMGDQRQNRSPKNQDVDKVIKECMRRRHLLLLLLSNEIERISVWLQANNGFIDPAPTDPQEQSIDIWFKAAFPDGRINNRSIKDITKNAWDISPQLAIYLPTRFRKVPTIRSTLEECTKANPELVSHLPEALPLLLNDGSVFEDGNEGIMTHVLTWAKCTPVMALSLLSPRLFPLHPITIQYAIRVLKSYPPNVLLLYIPQMVQAVRHDSMGYVHEFMLWLAGHSQLLAHQLLWNMQANIYQDEEGLIKDPVLFEPLTDITNKILANLEGAARSFYTAEFTVFNKITRISGAIKSFPKGPERKSACLSELKAFLLDIDYNSATPMQSAAKAPFLVRFSVCQCGVDKLEDICLEQNREYTYEVSEDKAIEEKRIRHFKEFVERIRATGRSIQDKCAIFKVGDDVRQDMLALQLMQLMKNIFDTNDIDVCLFPYRVVATAPGCGVIECVPNSKSRDQLGRMTDYGLYDYFRQLYGEETGEAFQNARRNFVRSMAAYSVFSFLLQIKDRHNGNIMIDDRGNIIHIDFGFMFESSPGGNLGFEPDFKLSQEMVAIMGGKPEAAPFKQFVSCCIKSYLAIRPHQKSFISLVSLLLDTGLPCFRGKTIQQFRARFSPDVSEREAARYMSTVINNCYMNVRSKMYDQLQYLQNDIPY